MANVRVYELARKAGVDTKVVLDKMTELGHFVRSASATVEAPVVRELIDALGVAQETAVSLPRVPAPAAPPAGSGGGPPPPPWDPPARWRPGAVTQHRAPHTRSQRG
ncbi:translation initiation factor IF-2 N-terminal domain-containing protein, partial [Streptomyces pseudogriseolus]|uniref:translation initiation factor IF-2 N-terminal domain-containing protein n=1 Tax=Streptomyces pseudogriseolus TaxID=36817 RepID=UPI0036A3EC0E